MKIRLNEATIKECDIYKLENGHWSVVKHSDDNVEKLNPSDICSKIGELEENTFPDLSMLEGADTTLSDIKDYCEVSQDDLIIYFVHNFNERRYSAKFGYALLSKNVFHVNIDRLLQNDRQGILGNIKDRFFKLFSKKRDTILDILGIENGQVKFTNIDDMCGNFTGAIFDIFKSLRNVVSSHSPIITASMMSKTSYRLLPLLKRAHLTVAVDEEDRDDMHELNIQGNVVTSSTHDIMLIDNNTVSKLKSELGIFYTPFMKIIGKYLSTIN